MRYTEVIWLLLLGTLFGLLIGSALDAETRSWTIRILVLFITGSVLAMVTTRRRE